MSSRHVEALFTDAWHLCPRGSVWGLALCLLVAPACRSAHGQTAATYAGGPDLTIGAAQHRDADAIILRWEQHWTLAEDGSMRRRDHKWTKLLNNRPIRATADPKLDFCQGEDEIIIHTAQTMLPDGEILPVPDYSFNLGATPGMAGWPEYAGWRQRIISFSGVQPGATLELDYEVVTKGGILPWLSADLRLDDDYPIIERLITVTVPASTRLRHRLDGESTTAKITATEEESNGTRKYSWRYGPLPGSPGEAQSLPWQECCPRLRCTTAPDASQWATAALDAVRQAAQPHDALARFAADAADGETDVAEQVRTITEKIQARFNFLDSPQASRSLRCRPADEVLRSNYGNQLEAGALCLAACRALGIDADVALAVDSETWSEEIPTQSGFAGVVVIADTPDGPVFAHPHHGVFTDPGNWGGHRLLTHDDSTALRTTDIRARGEDQGSDLEVAGKIVLADDGGATGELRLHLTGAFYDPDQLKTADDQERFIKRLVGRLVSDLEVTGHSINTLSRDSLRASVNVASDDGLTSLEEDYLLALGEGPVFLHDFPMPLDRSYRTTDVRLAGRFRENVRLSVELPENWTARVLPAGLAPVSGDWGAIEQNIKTEDGAIRLQRSIELNTDTIAAGRFQEIRRAVNDLRATGSRILLAGPTGAE